VRAKTVNTTGNIFNIYLDYFTRCNFQNARRLALIFSRLEPKEMAKLVSALNTYIKKEMSRIYPPNIWMKAIDLGNLVGFPKAKDRVFKDDVHRWLTEPGPECSFTVDQIYAEMCTILGPQTGTGGNKYHTLDAFTKARYTWANSGASKYSELEYKNERIKTKLGSALSLTDKQLARLVSREGILADGLRAFVKPDEKGVKGRNIVNAPIGMYIRQKYLLESLLDGHLSISKQLTMFTSAEDKIQTIQRDIDLRYHIPIDFESFDYNVSFKFWEAWNRLLMDRLDEEGRQCQTILHSLFGNIDVYDADGIKTGKWEKGMPSGLYVTSFCGSLFNLVTQRLVEKISNGKYKAGLAQGDDGDMTTEDTPDLAELARYVSYAGMVVNIQKNWYTFGITEFLKQVVTKSAVYQYPARAYSSLVWAYPDFRNIDVEKKLVSLATIWKEFMDRMGITSEGEMIKDIHAAILHKLKWTKSRVRNWLHTPTQLGGFGLIPLEFTHKYTFKFEQLKLAYKHKRYRRYPTFENVFRDAEVAKFDPHKRIMTLRQHQLSIETIFGKTDITFEQYIEYMRWEMNLPSTIQYPFSKIKASSSLLFRKFGWSDTFVNNYFGHLEMSNIGSVLVSIMLDIAQNPMVNVFTSQLWK